MDSALILLIFGVILSVIGAILFLAGIPDVGRRRRIVRTPTSSIAGAPAAGVIAIGGRILAAAEGLVTAPFSGEEVVWVRVTVEEYRQSWRTGHDWRTLALESDSRPFLVDDGSGETARVLPRNATVVVAVHRLTRHESVHEALPRLEAMLRGRGRSTSGWLGSSRTMRYKEEVLRPGDSVRVLGPSRREAGPRGAVTEDALRRPQLVVAHGGAGQMELLLTSESEERLVAKLLWKFVVGLAVGGIGLALASVGVAMGALAAFD